MSGRFTVLVVDDDKLNRVTTAQQLQKRGYEAEGVENGFAALQALEGHTFDVVVTDLRMPTLDGLDLLRKIRARWPEIEIILMTAFATVETAVEAIQSGAADYLVKPFKIEQLIARLSRLREQCQARSELRTLRTLIEERGSLHGLLGYSPGMQEVFRRIQIFAGHRAPVLITGQTGTGKELVARALHLQSERRAGPFVPIACGTIPLELAESELFGHERGSFTGALQQRIGSFERANGGTVLLDDVDDLPLNIQVKLLRVLQEGTIVRVGGQSEKPIDVRIVATSKVNLERAVAEQKFRDDLFYRLRGLEIAVPRLADRGDDVLLLAQHFLRTSAALEGRPPAQLTVEAAKILRANRWPGNVRELRRAMESAEVLAGGKDIQPEHLPTGPRPEQAVLFALHLDGCEEVSFSELVEAFQDALVQWALEKAGGQQKRASELLGVPRTTLQSRLSRNRER